MKVILVNTLFPPVGFGGAERSVALLADGLARIGVEPVVVTLATGDEPSSDAERGYPCYRLPLQNLFWPYSPKRAPTSLEKIAWHAIDSFNPMMARAVRDIAERERPAVIHTNNLTGFSAAVLRSGEALGIPVVHTLRDYGLLCPKTSMFKHGRDCGSVCASCKPFALPRRRLARSVRAVVGISRLVLERHRSAGFFSGEMITRVIPNPHGGPIAQAGKRSTTGALTLGYLSGIREEKGVGMLLEALAPLTASGRVKLILAGRKDYAYGQVIERQFASEHIVFPGFIEPSALFDQVDALVIPSLWSEPFGRTGVEAFAHGIPVIASDRAGFAEFIEPGANGFVFDPAAPDRLRELVARLADDQGALARMREQALSSAADFSPDRIAQSYLDLYEQVRRP